MIPQVVRRETPKYRKRKAPASQGHPSQGAPTVGGGTNGHKIESYRTPAAEGPHPEPVHEGAVGGAHTSFKKGVQGRVAEPFSLESLINSHYMYTDPQDLQRFNTKEMLDEMWPMLGLGGPEPNLYFNEKQSGVETSQGNASGAYVHPGLNNIYIQPMTPWGMHDNPENYDLLAHESRHTRQPLGLPAWQAEGEAVDFQNHAGRSALRRLGIDAPGNASLTPEYQSYLRRYLRR